MGIFPAIMLWSYEGVLNPERYILSLLVHSAKEQIATGDANLNAPNLAARTDSILSRRYNVSPK